MNHTFDVNDIFIDLGKSFNLFPESEEKLSQEAMPTIFTYSEESPQDQLVDYFSLERYEPNQVNHVWQDNQEDQLMDKLIYCSRKDTADSQEINQSVQIQGKKGKRKFDHLQKNETKNIPKNYGKAILAFIEKNKRIVKIVMDKYKAGTSKELIQYLEHRKKEITTIADLRSLWVDNPYDQVIRTLSCLFLRKYSLNYIFNSRVCNHVSHIKYRQRFLEAIKAPNEFKHIKDF